MMCKSSVSRRVMNKLKVEGCDAKPTPSDYKFERREYASTRRWP